MDLPLIPKSVHESNSLLWMICLLLSEIVFHSKTRAELELAAILLP